MRAEVSEYKFGEYSFTLELDTGGDPEYPYILWIYQNGQPLLVKKVFKEKVIELQARREFAKNYNYMHLKNFCLKFANNEEYRNQFLQKYFY